MEPSTTIGALMALSMVNIGIYPSMVTGGAASWTGLSGADCPAAGLAFNGVDDNSDIFFWCDTATRDPGIYVVGPAITNAQVKLTRNSSGDAALYGATEVDISSGSGDVNILPAGDDVFLDGTSNLTLNIDATPKITSTATLEVATTGDITLSPSGDDVVVNGTTDVTISTATAAAISSAGSLAVNSAADMTLAPTGDDVLMDGSSNINFNLATGAGTVTGTGTLKIISTGDTTIEPTGDDVIFSDLEGVADINFHLAEDGSQGMAIQGQVSFLRDNNAFAAISGVNGVKIMDELFYDNQGVTCSAGAGASVCGGLVTVADSIVTLTCQDADTCAPSSWASENPSHTNSILMIRCVRTTGDCVLVDVTGINVTGTRTFGSGNETWTGLWDGAQYDEIGWADPD